MMSEVIAVDGPAASGKSTVARRVAGKLGWLFVDSGSLYRTVTWLALENGIDTENAQAVAGFAESIEFGMRAVDGAVCPSLNGHEPGLEIRGDEVNRHVSPVARVPEVRQCVNRWLRGMRELGSLVVEGRDIGSAVFPDADYKFYIDASPEERARRRHAEEASRKDSSTLDAVAASIERRDRIDSSRKTDPLKVPEGAAVIDSTGLSIDEVVSCLLKQVETA